MTDVTSTPPALRWVALFLAACAVLGLFLGFRDQIRKNPPGWYTGAEQVATPLTAPAGGADAREAVPFDANAPKAVTPAAPAAKTPAQALEDPADAAPETATTTAGPVAPPVLTPTPAPKLKPLAPAATAAPSSDPVGDILEGQKTSETPAVPY